MQIPISDFEVKTLDKIIHTHTFGEYHDLELALYDLVGKDKLYLINDGKTTEHDFKDFQAQTVRNILQFLEHSEFIGRRDGGVHFLTIKGEDLRREGTLEKYIAWEQGREAGLLSDLHTIEEKGYLEKDQIAVREEVKKLHKEEEKHPLNKNMPWYILILIIIALIVIYGRSHIF